jgi:hypothetical protein
VLNLLQHPQDLLEMYNERPTGKKHTNVGWDEGGKMGKIIN